VQVDRPAPARRLMESALAIDPRQQWPCLLLVESCRALDDWRGVRSAFESTAAAVHGRGLDDALVDAYVEALGKTGDAARARAFQDSVARLAHGAGEGAGR